MVAKEGNSDVESKTTDVDGIAGWPLRAGRTFRACVGDFLRDGRRGIPGAEVPDQDVSAGSGTFVERGAGAGGRGGSGKRGIHPAPPTNSGQGAGQKQEHRSGDARG